MRWVWDSDEFQWKLLERKWLKFIRFSLPLSDSSYRCSRNVIETMCSQLHRHNIHIIIHDMQKTFVLFIPLCNFFFKRQMIDWWQPCRRMDYLQFCHFQGRKSLLKQTPHCSPIDKSDTTIKVEWRMCPLVDEWMNGWMASTCRLDWASFITIIQRLSQIQIFATKDNLAQLPDKLIFA